MNLKDDTNEWFNKYNDAEEEDDDDFIPNGKSDVLIDSTQDPFKFSAVEPSQDSVAHRTRACVNMSNIPIQNIDSFFPFNFVLIF